MSSYLDENKDVQIIYSASKTIHIDETEMPIKTVERPAKKLRIMLHVQLIIVLLCIEHLFYQFLKKVEFLLG